MKAYLNLDQARERSSRKVYPFVTVLTADPKTGFGGGETAAYASKVGEEHRVPTSSVPRVEVVPASHGSRAS